MIIYFAGSQEKLFDKILSKVGAKNRLLSFFYSRGNFDLKSYVTGERLGEKTNENQDRRTEQDL